MTRAKKGSKLIIKSKGVPGRIMKKEFSRVERFEDTLFKNEVSTASFRRFQSQDHVVRHLEVTKVALSGENDKVFMVSPYASRPLGHWKNRSPEDPVCLEWVLDDNDDEILKRAQELLSRGEVLPPAIQPIAEYPLIIEEAVVADEDDD